MRPCTGSKQNNLKTDDLERGDLAVAYYLEWGSVVRTSRWKRNMCVQVCLALLREPN